MKCWRQSISRTVEKLPEELGDVLLQVLFHSQIAAEAGTFTIEDVLDQLADKFVRRHPHVFPNGSKDPVPTNADQVLAKWEDIKRAERQAAGTTGVGARWACHRHCRPCCAPIRFKHAPRVSASIGPTTKPASTKS